MVRLFSIMLLVLVTTVSLALSNQQVQIVRQSIDFCEKKFQPFVFRCTENPSKCLPGGMQCDGYPDCANDEKSSDELQCLNFSSRCCEACFKCSKTGRCIMADQVCDGIQDCHTVIVKSQFGPDYCNNPKEIETDSNTNCALFADETDESSYACNNPRPCGPSKYKCGHRCLPVSKPCLYWAGEQRCPDSQPVSDVMSWTTIDWPSEFQSAMGISVKEYVKFFETTRKWDHENLTRQVVVYTEDIVFPNIANLAQQHSCRQVFCRTKLDDDEPDASDSAKYRRCATGRCVLVEDMCANSTEFTLEKATFDPCGLGGSHDSTEAMSSLDNCPIMDADMDEHLSSLSDTGTVGFVFLLLFLILGIVIIAIVVFALWCGLTQAKERRRIKAAQPQPNIVASDNRQDGKNMAAEARGEGVDQTDVEQGGKDEDED